MEALRHQRLETKLQERLAKRKNPDGAEGGAAQVAQQAAQERVERRLKAEYSSDRAKQQQGAAGEGWALTRVGPGTKIKPLRA